MNKAKDAIRYFEEQGFLEELTRDKKFYTKELIAEVKRLMDDLKGIETERNTLLTTATELSTEVDNLAYENKQLAKHLIQNGYTQNEVDSIAKGFDDWRENDN